MIMHNCESRVGLRNWEEEEGVNHRIGESFSWHLNKLTDGVVTIEMRSQSLTNRTLQNFGRVTAQALPQWLNKEEARVQIQYSW